MKTILSILFMCFSFHFSIWADDITLNISQINSNNKCYFGKIDDLKATATISSSVIEEFRENSTQIFYRAFVQKKYIGGGNINWITVASTEILALSINTPISISLNFGGLDNQQGENMQHYYRLVVTFGDNNELFSSIPNENLFKKISSEVLSPIFTRFRNNKLFFSVLSPYSQLSINKQFSPTSGNNSNPSSVIVDPIIVKPNSIGAYLENKLNNLQGITLNWRLGNIISQSGSSFNFPQQPLTNNQLLSMGLVNGGIYTLSVQGSNSVCPQFNNYLRYERAIQIRYNDPTITIQNNLNTISNVSTIENQPTIVSCPNISIKFPFLIPNKTFIKVTTEIVGLGIITTQNITNSISNNINALISIPNSNICLSPNFRNQLIKMNVLVEDGPYISEKSYYLKLQ